MSNLPEGWDSYDPKDHDRDAGCYSPPYLSTRRQDG